MASRTNLRTLMVVTAIAGLMLGGCTSLTHEFRGVVPPNMPADTVLVVPVIGGQALAKAPSLTGRMRIGDGPPVEVAVQAEPANAEAGTPARVWVACKLDPAMAGKPVVLQIESATSAARHAYAVRYADPEVEVATPKGDPILAYRYGEPDPDWKYPLTSFIHPVIGLDGEVLTDSITKDHPHHRGIFWAWVRLTRHGHSVGEWWIPRDIVLEAHDLKTATGPVFATFEAKHYYVFKPHAATNQPADLKPGQHVLDESVVCRVFETTDAGRAIDIDLTLTALVDGLAIGGQTQLNKGYGGLTARFGADATHSGKPRSPRVVADGKFIEKDQNCFPARWIDCTAVFDGADGKPLSHRSGGAVFVHPSHPPLPASPPEWITRNYGPINVSYPGLNMLDLPQGKPLRLRYRLWLHRDDAEPANVADEYAAYAADWNWRIMKPELN